METGHASVRTSSVPKEACSLPAWITKMNYNWLQASLK